VTPSSLEAGACRLLAHSWDHATLSPPSMRLARWRPHSVLLSLIGLLLVVSFLAPPALALDPKRAITQYVLDVWQTEQGLPQNSINAICQTRDGYLWLGTSEGFDRFDGVRFTVFDKRNIPELKGNWFRGFAADRDGSLWIGTSGGGLNRLRDGKLTVFTTKEGLSNESPSLIYEDRAGNLWIGTGGGLSRSTTRRSSSFARCDGHAPPARLCSQSILQSTHLPTQHHNTTTSPQW
jgi:ligand-binding sensor domain-containing protein